MVVRRSPSPLFVSVRQLLTHTQRALKQLDEGLRQGTPTPWKAANVVCMSAFQAGLLAAVARLGGEGQHVVGIASLGALIGAEQALKANKATKPTIE